MPNWNKNIANLDCSPNFFSYLTLLSNIINAS